MRFARFVALVDIMIYYIFLRSLLFKYKKSTIIILKLS